MRRRFSAPLAVAAATLALSAPAGASWHPAGDGDAYARAAALAAGTESVASASGRDVTVSWTASGGPVAIDGYEVRRYDSEGVAQTIGAACAGTQAGLSCTEVGVDPGEWRYSVTPARAAWRGAEGPLSPPVVVAAPSLTLEPATVEALPASLNGEIGGFLSGETVEFRLDDPESGPSLSGSITPSPVPAGGGADVELTLPAEVVDGVHTLYAVGDEGDVAAAEVLVEAACSEPGEVTLAASQDSYVDSLLPSQNFGTAATLEVGPAYLLVLAQQLAMVQFSLPAVPERCSLAAATLRLYVSSPGTGRTIEAVRAGGAWTETGITWSNLPGTTGAAATSASLASAGWQEWNLLPQVNSIYGGATNNGFVVKDSAASGILAPHQTYRSRTGTPESQTPQLVLEFE